MVLQTDLARGRLYLKSKVVRGPIWSKQAKMHHSKAEIELLLAGQGATDFHLLGKHLGWV